MRSRNDLFLFSLALFLYSGLIGSVEDSLRNLLRSMPADTERVNTLNKLAFEIRSSDPGECLELSDEAFLLAQKTLHGRGEAVALLHKGFAWRNMNEPSKAVHFYQLALNRSKEIGNLKVQGQVYNALGNIYNSLSNLYISLDYHRKALAIRSQLKDSVAYALSLANMSNVLSKLGKTTEAKENFMIAIRIQRKTNERNDLATSLNGIANIYTDEGSYVKALENYLMALKIFDESNDLRGKSVVLNNIGNCHYYLEDFTLAEKYYRQAIDIAEETNDTRAKARSGMNIGALYLKKHQAKESLPYYEKALEQYRDAKDKGGEATVLSALAVVYIELGNTKLGEEKLEQSLRISRAINNLLITQETYEQLYKTYDERGEFQKALYFHKKMVELSDSLSKADKEVKIEELETAFDMKEKESQIAMLNQENKMREEKIRDQRIIVAVAIAASVIFLIMLVLIYKSNQKSKAANVALSDAYGLIHEKNKNISDSIQYAKKIQDAMLAPVEQIRELLPESFVLFLPKDVVSGDFYWITGIDIQDGQQKGERVIGVAAVDCTGHGVPGALMSMMGNTLLNQTLKEKINGPGDALTYLHRQLPVMLRSHGQTGSVRDGMDMSFISLHLQRGAIMFAGANNPALMVSKSKLIEIKADRMAIGGTDTKFEFNSQVIKVQPGDQLYLFSDGYADQFGGPKGKKMNYSRFKELVLELSALPIETQQEEFQKRFLSWKGDEEQVDDVLLIGIRIQGTAFSICVPWTLLSFI